MKGFVGATLEVDLWRQELSVQVITGPQMREDCKRYAQRCKQCQQYADWHKAPPEELRSIYSPWPFHTWGIDILGPFSLAIRKMKYLVVAIEYFTKWIKAEPIARSPHTKSRVSCGRTLCVVLVCPSV